MSARVISKQSDTTWDLRDIAAVQRHIQSFPHSKTLHGALHVEITRLSKSDLGQIVEIWQKTNKFIEIVQGASPNPHVHVSLTGKWRHTGRLVHSVVYPEGYRPNHDIAIIPFTRLNDWDYSLPKYIRTALFLESQSPHPSLLDQIRERDGARMNRYHSICGNQGTYDGVDLEQWLTETRIFLDSQLDNLPGETAERLRLERCLNWYEDGDKWTSAYETQFIADLAANPELIGKFDSDLLHIRERHKLTMLLHHAIHEQLHYIEMCGKSAPHGAEKQDLTEGVIDNVDLHTRWNENIWSTKMKGIKVHRSWNSKNWSKVYTRVIFVSLARLQHPGHDVNYTLYTNEISNVGEFSRVLASRPR
ncbi:uncharacterized protein N7459_004728 [Penicillium hispanicum]|uniref:uncharacterized protein n=1 Tax=Penicillium hispanicum TaxID=1080232 RepID=UPI0025401A79|nr:uncharacterized protein N7459_004728 [Penicillium hispanicum]KAJ5584928.1 hypothetical protein N7459_004728 [Penicillium hispanicum]